MKRRTLFPLIPLVALLLSCMVNLSAQEVRVFTNKAGVEITATLIEIVGDSDIRIKRSGDGKEFLLKIVSLSLNDQKFVAEQLKTKGAVEPRTLMISVPNGLDRFAPVTDNSIWYIPYISGKVGRMAIPVGTWVSYAPTEITGRFLIPYYGEKHWKVEIAEDRTVWLSRDNREKELIGISLPDHEPEDDSAVRKALRALDLSKVKHAFSVSCHEKLDVEMLQSLPAKLPLAITMRHRLTSEQIDILSRKNLIAIRTFQNLEFVPELGRLENLKFLWIKIDGIAPGGSITFPEMPGLEHFAILDGAEKVEWDESLKNFPNLRSLTTIHTHKSYEMLGYRGNRNKKDERSDATGSPITTFENNPKLNFLVVGARQKVSYISPKVLTTAPNLEYLRLHGGVRFVDESDYDALVSLQKLQYLYLSAPAFPVDMLDHWFDSGALSELRDFFGYFVPRFKDCPKLEAIRISQMKDASLDFERFAKAPAGLKYIELNRLSGDDVDGVNLPNPELVEYLSVTSCGVDEPESLYRFKNLKHFVFSRNAGWLARIDLNRFPLLENASISQAKDIESIVGISSHPNLTRFYLGYLPNLYDLGEEAPNDKIFSVLLGNLPKLKSLNSFDQFTGCSRLSILNCDLIESYGTFKKNNDLSSIVIKDCAKLPDYTRVPFR